MQKKLHIYSQTTARIHLHKLMSDKFPITGVRHSDPLSLKVFTAVLEKVF